MKRLLNVIILTATFYVVAPFVLDLPFGAILFTKAFAASILLLIVAEVLHKPAEVIFYTVDKNEGESE